MWHICACLLILDNIDSDVDEHASVDEKHDENRSVQPKEFITFSKEKTRFVAKPWVGAGTGWCTHFHYYCHHNNQKRNAVPNQNLF